VINGYNTGSLAGSEVVRGVKLLQPLTANPREGCDSLWGTAMHRGLLFRCLFASLPACEYWLSQGFYKLCSAPVASGMVLKQHGREFVTSSLAWKLAWWDLWMLCRYVNKTVDNLTPLLFNLKRNQWGGGGRGRVTKWTGQVDFDQKVNLLT